MFKPQMKFQKTLFIVLLILSGVVFVFSLGIMTDMYGLYQTQTLGGIPGSKIFYDMQSYNHYMVLIAIALILISALPFIFASNKRRKYYKGNTVTSFIQAGAFVLAAVYMVINSLKYRAQFLKTVDFALYKEMATTMNFVYSESTFFFDAGLVIAVLLVAGAAAIIYNLNWKNKLVKQEEAILKGEVTNG